jgi:hypothetical protein
MNYGELVPVLVSALQEQQAEIEEQAERIAGLERRVGALEGAGGGRGGQQVVPVDLSVLGLGTLVLGGVVVYGRKWLGGRS